ncbi:MAG: hypothetical protein JXP34_20860, partial [Planctomycetes bacterium]|nr:hypothetical protein [Planctomycetota bacterium]
MRSASLIGLVLLLSPAAGQDPPNDASGGEALRLSGGATQDSDPAACRLADGRVAILWRAFVGLPETRGSSGTARRGSGGDRICAVILDAEGRPGETFDVLDEPGDVERIAIVPEGPSGVLAVWAEQRDGNWDIFARSIRLAAAGIERDGIDRLTRDPGVDRSPVVGAASDGTIVLAWQGWREARSSIFLRARRGAAWEEPIPASEGGNAWSPAIAASDAGEVAVAWMSWNGSSYDIRARVRTGGAPGPIRVVAGDARRHEALPSLAYDREGNLWIAYEEGREDWGMDSHTAGLRARRDVRLALLRGDRIEAPAGDAALRLPEAFDERSEMAHLARDGRGALWLFFRGLAGRGVWTIHGCVLGDGGWNRPLALAQSAGGQDVPMATAVGGTGALLAIRASDHRTNQVGHDSHLYLSAIPPRAPRADPVAGRPVGPWGAPASDAGRPARPTAAAGGARLSLLF